jgi:hypothetical protein
VSEYVRITRECSVSQLHPALLQAIQAYFQEHRLGYLEAEAQMCCETMSKRKNVSETLAWLSGKPDTFIYTGILLTAQSLIWVHFGDVSGTRLNAANLNDIRVEFHTPLFTKDAGLQIIGYINDAKVRVHGYIGMGTEVAAQKFCEEVKQAINKINPPAKRDLFRWWSG